jgi:hypothetical protein
MHRVQLFPVRCTVSQSPCGARCPNPVPLLTLGDIFRTVPEEYHDYADVFCKVRADKLPPHRPFDHHIPLKEGAALPKGPIYRLSPLEDDALAKYVQENLEKGFITRSESPAASPVLFVKKKDGSLRMCVDYRKLNDLTIKNRYPLPLIGELLDRLGKAKHFTKMDLRGAYNLIRIKEGDEYKTAFRTRLGLFEYKVMPFGLTNAPATFQTMMNEILRDVLDKIAIVYLDDILVFSRTREEHIQHVRQILHRLRDHNLYAKHDKCDFFAEKLTFLGYVVSAQGISMDRTKVLAIRKWGYPRSPRDVKAFLGLVQYYRTMAPKLAHLAVPLYGLLKKDIPWNFTTSTSKRGTISRT